jgi:hypothetical protein
MSGVERLDTTSVNEGGLPSLNARCPFCKHLGVLQALRQESQDAGLPRARAGGVSLGMRRCPNPECRAALFVVYQLDKDGPVAVELLPPEVIDFDTTNLPTAVTECLEEAVKCHANACCRAGAMMVRRTLEEVCHEQGAQGKTLKDRLNTLSKVVALPIDLVTGLDELRLLGNDAAHVEFRDYPIVGEAELHLALDVTKEIIQAVYQRSELIQRLQARRRAAPPTA